jgi:hypothetical protein
VTLTSTDGLTTFGSFNVNFDDATPAGPWDAACTLSDVSLTQLGHSWTASEVTHLSVIFRSRHVHLFLGRQLRVRDGARNCPHDSARDVSTKKARCGGFSFSDV